MAGADRIPERLKPTVERIDQLIALFNRKAMDLPDGLFERATQFVLNGTAYEALLGRSPTDPLILMLARGPAGYRFIAKAVQHAVPDAAVQRGELRSQDGRLCQAELRLLGRLRGAGEAIDAMIECTLSLADNGAIRQAAVTVDPQTLDKLREARVRP
jgi:hypothetical protein